jgi:hypothetical protein
MTQGWNQDDMRNVAAVLRWPIRGALRADATLSTMAAKIEKAIATANDQGIAVTNAPKKVPCRNNE